jgi:NTP pyrophosphatase (non-canonical NTP hydrolase)
MEEPEEIAFPNPMRTIQDFQAFHRWLDEKNDFDTDILFNLMLLIGEIGEVTQALKAVHWMTRSRRSGGEPAKSFEQALAVERENLGQELADCLAYIFKLANYMGIDLQAAYLQKMSDNMSRTWTPSSRQEEQGSYE